MSLNISAPLRGTTVALEDVPDPVFAQRLVGPGVAVQPTLDGAEMTAVAPVAGVVVKLHPHAFVIQAEGGKGVLVHLGIDTVKLAGDGFTMHVAEKDTVTQGQAIVTWNPTKIEDGGMPSICPVVALDGKAQLELAALPPANVAEGDLLATWS